MASNITRAQHPSGRPIKRNDVRQPTRWRVPDKGYVIPRLRQERKDLNLMGFIAPHDSRDDIDDE